MGRVIGRIEIDRNPARPAMEPPLMALDHRGGQFVTHRIEGVHPDVVFETRDRGLRGERIAVDGIASEQEFVDRVLREPIRVIRIGMAAGESIDALRQQILERVPHLPRLPIIDEAPGEALDQAVARLRGFEQDRPAIRTRVGLIKCRDQRFVEEVWEEDSLWYRFVAQSEASVVGKSSCGNGFVPCGGFCVSTEIGPFVNYPG
jgi:hypothetical protein